MRHPEYIVARMHETKQRSAEENAEAQKRIKAGTRSAFRSTFSQADTQTHYLYERTV